MSLRFLDTGPLDILAAVWTSHRWAWTGSIVHVVEEVANEVAGSSRGRELLAQKDTAGAPWVQRHSIVVGSAAQRLYTQQLRANSSSATTNVGEDASVALLATQFVGGVFVTMDGRATLSALLHLGPGGVETPFDCWAWLEGAGLVDAAVRAELDRRTEKAIGRQRPERFDRME